MKAGRFSSFLRANRNMLIALVVFILLPFLIGLMNGASPVNVWMNESGQSKFIQGLAIEIFIVPGFGVFGVLGLLFTISSLTLMMINNDWFDFTLVDDREIVKAISATLAGLFGGIILLFFGGVKLTGTKVFKRIALEDVQKKDEGYTSKYIKEDMIGKVGTAYTVLRPSGRIMIEGKMYDAFTRGGYINKGEQVIVIDDEGTSLKVKIHKEENNN